MACRTVLNQEIQANALEEDTLTCPTKWRRSSPNGSLVHQASTMLVQGTGPCEQRQGESSSKRSIFLSSLADYSHRRISVRNNTRQRRHVHSAALQKLSHKFCANANWTEVFSGQDDTGVWTWPVLTWPVKLSFAILLRSALLAGSSFPSWNQDQQEFVWPEAQLNLLLLRWVPRTPWNRKHFIKSGDFVRVPTQCFRVEIFEKSNPSSTHLFQSVSVVYTFLFRFTFQVIFLCQKCKSFLVRVYNCVNGPCVVRDHLCVRKDTVAFCVLKQETIAGQKGHNSAEKPHKLFTLIPCSQRRTSIFGGIFNARFCMWFNKVVFPCLKRNHERVCCLA